MGHRHLSSRLRAEPLYAGLAFSVVWAASAAAFLLQPGCGGSFEADHDASNADANDSETLTLEAGFSEAGIDIGDGSTKDSTKDAEGTLEAHAESAQPDADVTKADGDMTTPDAEAGPGGCDPSATPQSNPCVISEAYGVFVAPMADGGNDTSGSGTRAHPYATLGAAIPRAAAAHLRVYACGATYPEALLISASTSTDGVAIYGGLECPTVGDGGAADAGSPESGTGPWSYSGTLATVAPTATGYALDVESLAVGAHFEDMAFIAQPANASTPGASSIAVMVNASSSVSFLRVAATAGDAAAGNTVTGVPTSNWCDTSSLNGTAGTFSGSATQTGGAGGVCACLVPGAVSSAGGSGGDGSNPAQAGVPGTPSALGATAPDDGDGGIAGTGTAIGKHAGGNGDPGANGAPGVAGGAGGVGYLSATGWSPVAGGSGGIGLSGQGGGGGGGAFITLFSAPDSSSGGGGGAGGCGGNGGSGGGGGGASFGVAIVNSTVSLNAVAIQTGDGGGGGGGGDGQAGQAGGTGQPGGMGTAGPTAGMGGNGGQGAGGGGGGGGAGGPSVGIAWTGTPPKIDGASTSAASALSSPSTFAGGPPGGSAGPGGMPGAAVTSDGGIQGNAGNPGTAGPAGYQAAVRGF